uniref:Uncharacterized protein n=1 Tax=Tetranychus urticae TaxID=32264 RepID=T1L0J3_TETUR
MSLVKEGNTVYGWFFEKTVRFNQTLGFAFYGNFCCRSKCKSKALVLLKKDNLNNKRLVAASIKTTNLLRRCLAQSF